MDLAEPLAIVTPTVDAAVLTVLAGADAEFTGRQVQTVAGRHSEKGVRNALHRLVGQGIVTSRRVGAADLYRLNREHLAAPYVEALAKLPAELLRRLRSEFTDWQVAPAFAARFGSAARGDMRLDSDIDVFVVRPIKVDPDAARWRVQLDVLASNITAWTGNDGRVLELEESEVARGLSAGDTLLAAIRDEGVPLYGSPTYLLAGSAKPGATGRSRRRPPG